MPIIQAIRADSTTEYIGVFLVIFGFFLILAGLEIFSVEKITVKPGRKTWSVGVMLAIFGSAFLLPGILGSFSKPAPTANQASPQPVNTPAMPPAVPTETASKKETVPTDHAPEHGLVIAAAKKGDLVEVKRLHRLGADLNEGYEGNTTPLIHASCHGGKLGLVKYLVENGARVNHIDDHECTALYLASGFHRLAIVKYLITQGAEVNYSRESDGWTPLMYAIAKGKDLAMVRYLIEQGADIKSRTIEEGYSALRYAAAAGHLEIVKYLHKKGADLNEKNSSALIHASCHGGNLELVQYLVENGARVNHIDDHECTALYLASGFHRLAIVKYLITQGANVNYARESDGWTPLMYAIAKGKDFAMVKYLVEQGANINHKDHRGKTPLRLAQDSNLKNIVQFLKERTELTGQVQTEKYLETISFNIPNETIWTKTSDNKYIATGPKDTFAWSEKIVEGDIVFKVDIEGDDGTGHGEGIIIVYGDGRGWSEGCLIFNIASQFQGIRAHTPYKGVRWLSKNNEILDFKNRRYSMTIKIIGDKASLYLDDKKIASIFLTPEIKRRGRIGLFKYHGSPDVTYSNIRLSQPNITKAE